MLIDPEFKKALEIYGEACGKAIAAEFIKHPEILSPWQTPEQHAAAIVDDARGLHSSDTVVEHFQRASLSASKPNKSGGRVRGWVTIRQLLHNAVEQNGGPVLLIHESCTGLLATLPAAPRDKKRTNDVASSFTLDHHIDALSMLVNHFTTGLVRQGTHVGMY